VAILDYALDARSPKQQVWQAIWRFCASGDFLRYVVFGGVAAVVNLVVAWLFYAAGDASHVPYWAATAIGGVAGLCTNFVLNYSLNFKFRRRSAIQQFQTFCVVAGFGIAITSGASTVLRSLLYPAFGHSIDFHFGMLRTDLIADLAAVGLTIFYSYPAHKILSFNVGLRARLRQLVVLMVEK
jgi:putative flippase GtrA